MQNTSEYKFNEEYTDIYNYDDFIDKVIKFKRDKQIPGLIRKMYIRSFKSHASVLSMVIDNHKKYPQIGSASLESGAINFVAFFGTSELLEMDKKAKEIRKILRELK